MLHWSTSLPVLNGIYRTPHLATEWQGLSSNTYRTFSKQATCQAVREVFIKLKGFKSGTVAYDCNPSYSGSWGKKITSLWPTWATYKSLSQKTQTKTLTRDWWGGSEVRSIHCSFRGSEFSSYVVWFITTITSCVSKNPKQVFLQF